MRVSLENSDRTLTGLAGKSTEVERLSGDLVEFSHVHPHDAWMSGLETICYELSGLARSGACRRIRMGFGSRFDLDAVSRMEGLVSTARFRIDTFLSGAESQKRAESMNEASSLIWLGTACIGLAGAIL